MLAKMSSYEEKYQNFLCDLEHEWKMETTTIDSTTTNSNFICHLVLWEDDNNILKPEKQMNICNLFCFNWIIAS